MTGGGMAQLVRDILVEPAPPASVLSATARLAGGVGLHNCVVRSGAAKCSCVALSRVECSSSWSTGCEVECGRASERAGSVVL